MEKFLELVKRIESEGYRVFSYEPSPTGEYAFVVERIRGGLVNSESQLVCTQQ